MRIILAALVAAALAAPIAAQAPDSANIELKQRVDAIFGVPQKADEARSAGTPASTIESIMRIFGQEKVAAEDVAVILTSERDAARAGQVGADAGKDNFGAFVQSQHAAGLRGRELAAAIHAEQIRRGMKKGGPEMGGHDDAMAKDKKSEAAMNKGKKPEEAQNKGKKPSEAPTKGKKPNDAARSSR